MNAALRPSATLASLASALLSLCLVVTLVVPGGEPPPPAAERESRAECEQRLNIRQWLRKNLRETDVRMRLGEPERVESYGLLSFWRYEGQRTIIFDSSGQVIGWENF